jgi:hypothetical protein
MRKQLCAALLLLFCAIAPAYAEFVVFNLTGAISDVSPELGSAFAVGAPVSGVFSYDTSVADVFPDPNGGEYPGGFNSSVLFGSYAVGGTGGSVFVGNDQSGRDFFTGFLTSAEVSGAALGAFVPVRLELSLEDFGATVFSSDLLPAASQLANVSAFDSPFIVLFFQNPAGDLAIVDAAITALQPQQVHEPRALALVVLGCGMLALLRRRERCSEAKRFSAG